MNFHIFQNEPKFIGDFIKISNNIDAVRQTYIAVNPSDDLPWIKENEGVVKVKSLRELAEYLRINASENDKVFFHSLTDEIIVLVANEQFPGKKYWIVWGWELYENISLNSIPKYDFVQSWPKSKLVNTLYYYKSLSGLNKGKKQIFKKFLSQISGILHYSKYDIELINTEYGTNVPMVPFFYKNVIDLKQLNSLQQENRNSEILSIILGNSATASNNHFSAMRELSSLKEMKFNLYLPLSYGPKEYARRVETYAQQKLFGKHVVISEFMGSLEYLKLLNSMDVAIMNQIRSQAMGNIIVLLVLGKTIYMNKKCTSSLLLKEIGIKFRFTDELRNLTSFKHLSEEEKSENKKRIMSFFDDEVQKNNLENIYSEESK